MRSARRGLLSIASKTALDLAALHTPRECHALVEREIREAMTAIADSAEGEGFTWDESPPPDALVRMVASELGVEVVARPLEAAGR